MEAFDATPYKELLLKLRAEALTTSEVEVASALHSEQAADEIDIATSDSQSALAHRLLDRKTSYVKRIDVALEKIEEGTYGECEDCGTIIAPKRLLARPMALLCVLCKEKQEKIEKKEKSTRGFLSGE
jgi:DnaK suppressor protein